MKKSLLWMLLLVSLLVAGIQTVVHAAACSAPVDLKCEYKSSNNTAILSWATVPGATYYEVELLVFDPECCPESPDPYIVNLPIVTSNSIIVSLSTYPCFSWRVRAKCENGLTAYSYKLCSCGEISESPCNTFNDNTYGNWGAAPSPDNNINFNLTATNPLDASTCLTIMDDSGGSLFINTVDFNNLGQNYLNNCFCYDFSLVDADSGNLPYQPIIYFTDGTNVIAFVAHDTLHPDSTKWITICAPIEHCTGTTPPGNAFGSWQMISPGMTCADFNNVLNNVTRVSLSPEINGSHTEIMRFDNFCIKDCPEKCNSNFTLTPSIQTATSTVTANVTLDNNKLTSTYTVNWGDGNFSSPFVSHLYAAPGNYTVCVTETMENNEQCKTCVPFCFGEVRQSEIIPEARPASMNNKVITLEDIKRIGEEELKQSQIMGYTISPNPANNIIELHTVLLEKQAITMQLTDMSGKIISTESGLYEKGTQSISMDTRKVANGIYIIKIKIGEKESTTRVSIIK